MKIGIISDTHDNIEAIKNFFSIFEEIGIKTVIHLGDLISPFVLDWINEVYSGHLILVKGNNDGELLFTMEKIKKYGYEYYEDPAILDIGGKKLAIMHKPIFLEELIETDSLDFILYGHTHKIDNREAGKVKIINPGEACGYLTNSKSYAILDLKTGEVKIERS